MTVDVSHDRKVGATISVQIPGGEYITRQLREGDVLSIGSDDTSELRLGGQGISGTHCILTVEQGFVSLRDCYSQTGTFVNDEKIQKVEIDHNCEIRIGESTITLTIKNPRKRKDVDPHELPVSAKPAKTVSQVDEQVNEELNKLRKLVLESRCEFNLEETESAPRSQAPQHSNSFEVESDMDLARDAANFDTPGSDQSQVTYLRVELEKVSTENAILKERLEKVTVQKTVFESDPFQQEMIELLREEVVSLQNQLAQAHEASLISGDSDSCLLDEPAPSQAEIERLAARLDDLLGELTQRDDQVELLQSLLHTAEDANQAELEEREQLSKWLSEFEQRFGEKAQEWKSETQYLTEKIRLLESERSETQAAIQADETSVEAEALHRVIESLRAQLVQGQEELHTLRQTNQTLKSELKEAQNSTSREEEVRLARERAEIARMRHEVEKKRAEIENINKKSDLLDSGLISQAEIKLREMRHELKDSPPKQSDSQTLSARLSGLWTRLNS